jgi:hypothetical protein
METKALLFVLFFAKKFSQRGSTFKALGRVRIWHCAETCSPSLNRNVRFWH